MFKKILVLLLVLAFTVSTLGCSSGSKNSAMKETLLAEGMLNEDTYILEAGGVRLKAHPVMNITEAKASIYEVSNAPSLDEDGNQLKVYDFRVEGVTQVDGVFELSIPLSVKEGEVPGAGYFNEETMEWEPVAFFYNPQAEVLTIYTDHLSKYGVFSYSRQGTRKAKMEFLGLYGDSEDVDFAAAVNEYSIAGVPGQDCYEIGVGAFSEAVGISSDILGNLGQAYGYAAYGTDVLDTIGDQLGSLGLLLSVVSIGNSIMNGNTHEAVVGSMKTSYTYVLGKVAGKLSNSVLSAGMAAVAIVDYSINKFGTEAIEGREDIYRDAYSIYYTRKEKGFKGSDYWYKTFYPLMANPTMSVDEMQAKIDEIVKAHCNEFWTETNDLGVDYYVSEARERLGFTGGGAGLNQDMRDRISAERRAMLYQDVLPGVFHQIALKINMENEELLRQEYGALSEYMNQSIGFTVIDPSKAYANHIARFASLNENADVDNWTGTFKEDGTLHTSFTLYGHISAGSPNKLNIYGPDADPDQDPPLETLEFVVTPPNIEIVIKNVSHWTIEPDKVEEGQFNEEYIFTVKGEKIPEEVQEIRLEYDFGDGGENAQGSAIGTVRSDGTAEIDLKYTYEIPDNLNADEEILYPVTVKIVNESSLLGSVSAIVKIKPVTVSILPSGIMTYELTEGAREVEHTFEAAVRPEGSYRFEWDFGDGSPTQSTQGRSSIISHTYTGTGTWHPKVMLYSDNGAKLAEDGVTIILEYAEGASPSEEPADSTPPADPVALDPDSDIVPVVSSGKFVCRTWINTSMDSFVVGGGTLTGANWSYSKGYRSYNLSGTAKAGETVSLSIAGTMGKMGYQMEHQGNDLVMTLKVFDTNGKEIEQFTQKVETLKSSSPSLGDTVSIVVPANASRVEMSGYFSCRWFTPYSGAGETVAVSVKLNVVK